MKNIKLQDYLAEFVYGGIDGSVTTFAVVAGAAGANLESQVVIILGFANLIADGFSMSVGSYLAHKSEKHTYEKYKRREYYEVHYNPQEGRDEIRDIYAKKGLSGETLNIVVNTITSDKDIWVDTMMKEELEMTPVSRSPYSKALVTFIAFILVGLVPLLAYLLNFCGLYEGDLFVGSSIMTAIAFVFIGILKSYVGEVKIWRGLAETLFLGAAAAVLAYFVGDILEKLF
jgi:VIT1/CCC1 family predicted Fe2+/Mn2+ transporter